MNHEKRIKELADQYGIEEDYVRVIFCTIGDQEDYDGLPNLLDEYRAIGLI